MWKVPAKQRYFHPQRLLADVLSRLPDGAMLAAFRRPSDARGRVEHPAERQADEVWSALLGRLRGTLTDTMLETWFGQAHARSYDGVHLAVDVPNEFTRNWIAGHFSELVSQAASDTAPGLSVTFTVGDNVQVRPAAPNHEPAGPAVPVPSADEKQPAQREVADGELNSKYTFDLFVIGSSNRFAHAAALAVAEAPAQAYNPLFIYGGTGLGKTHLLHAIGHYVRQHSRRLTTRYVPSETFMNEFIDAVRDRGARIEGFKRRYRNYDVLLVDDIQFIEGKERIQEEFFHTFNSLYEGGAQIVISSDRPPREIATLEERLRSRFEWGLLTDIQAPDLETRIAILRKRVETEGIAIDDPEVLTFIAGRVSANIRELEGALTRVVAFSSLTDRPLTVELAEDVLRDVYPQGDAPQPTITWIQEAVSQRFGVSIEELVSPRRSQAVAYPRQVAMYLSRELTDASLPMIGKEFGGRDHTTVIHAKDKITRLIREDRTVYNLVQELTARIKQAR
jgi:chromosomal replication initiator protein